MYAAWERAQASLSGCDSGAGRGDRFFRMAESLIGIAPIPEDDPQEGVASRAGVETDASGLDAVALGIVKREAVFEVPVRGSQAAQMAMDDTDHDSGLD